MSLIKVKGRYGKSKKIEYIVFDSSRLIEGSKVYSTGYSGKTEYYFYIRQEGRKITLESEAEMLSFVDQVGKGTSTPAVKEATKIVSLSQVQMVVARYIDIISGLEILIDLERYLFELPRFGETFPAHTFQWKVVDFIHDWDKGEVRIYATKTNGGL